MHQPQNIIAIVYDFDHTLSPHYMQDHTILRHAELDPSTFWKSCTALIEARDYDQELAYMKRMLEEPRIRTLSNQDLRGMGNQLSLDYDQERLNQLSLANTLNDLEKLGFAPVDKLPGEMQAFPLELEGNGGVEFWLALPNFYTITRYNHSHLYAMAVHQLSQLILERVNGLAS